MKKPEGLRRSQQQEKRVANRLGGTVNSGSGNGWLRKNDVRTPELSVELKYTAKRQYTLKLDDLLKAEEYALLDGREMLFGLEMGDREWAIGPLEDYYDTRDQITELTARVAELEEQLNGSAAKN